MTAAARLAPWGAAAAVVLGAPLIGVARAALLRAFPSAYVLILVGLALAGAALVLGFCLRRIRARRAPRLALLALAVAIAACAIALLRSGDPNIDAVEAFHFVEYSALTLLWFRPRPGSPGEAYLRAALATLAVGIADEWFQWFVPARAGELHDVLVDAVAIGCGLLLCAALDPGFWSVEPRPPVVPVAARRLPLGALAAGVVVWLGGFVSTVHLGYEIRDPAIGVFRSRFPAARLHDLGVERAASWRGGPPPSPGRYGREDQFEAEALWHVRRRNLAMDPDRHGDRAELDVAWYENLILERYFAAVLDVPSRDGGTGHRLGAEQLRRMDEGRAHSPAPFTSDAEAQPLLMWPQRPFWAAVLGAAGIVWGSAWWGIRRRTRRGRVPSPDRQKRE